MASINHDMRDPIKFGHCEQNYETGQRRRGTDRGRNPRTPSDNEMNQRRTGPSARRKRRPVNEEAMRINDSKLEQSQSPAGLTSQRWHYAPAPPARPLSTAARPHSSEKHALLHSAKRKQLTSGHFFFSPAPRRGSESELYFTA